MKTLDPGIHENISMRDYLELPYFHKSYVSPMLKSGLALRYHIDIEEPEGKYSDCIIAGQLVDTLLFEPKEFASRFSLLPDVYVDSKKKTVPFTKKSSTCRKVITDIIDEGKLPISGDDKIAADEIISAIQRHKTASTWLAGKSQVTIIWDDPITGVRCKGRIDMLLIDRIVDLKTSETTLPSAFSRIANSMGYHVQGAMYHDGYYCAKTGKIPESFDMPFSLIAAETSKPHDVVCYNLGVETLEVGRLKYREALDRFKACSDSNEWHGYSDFAEELEIPIWAKNRLQLEGVFDE